MNERIIFEKRWICRIPRREQLTWPKSVRAMSSFSRAWLRCCIRTSMQKAFYRAMRWRQPWASTTFRTHRCKIGPYKLREQIGEGGMGEVYVAEQTEPVRRKVALKIIRPGMATKDVVARFEAERQALAMMDHPNIAKVFDAGTTGDQARGGDGERGRRGELYHQAPSASPHLPLSHTPLLIPPASRTS